MTELRDARLQKALDHAPDADAVPQLANRVAIQNIASSAVQKMARAPIDKKLPWWKLLWQRSAGGGRPWSSAFATLLLGGVITLIWQGQEVSVQQQDDSARVMGRDQASAPGGTAASQVPAVPPQPLPSPSPPPPSPRSPPFAAPAATTQAVSPREAEALKSSAVSPGPSQQAKRPVQAALPEAAPPSKAVLQEHTVASAQAGAVGADKSRADAVPAPAAQQAQDRAIANDAPATATPAARPAPAPFAAAPAASVLRSAPAPAPAPAAAEPAGKQASTSATDRWTSAQLRYRERSVNLAQPRAQSLVAQANSLAESSASAPPAVPEGPAVLRLELRGQTGVLAVFELWDGVFRWQRAGQPDRLGAVDSATAQRLLAEAERASPP